MKIYIARDRAIFEDEAQENAVRRHPENEVHYGKLRLFYEKPKLNRETGVWECAREAAEVKRYMFPDVHCEECMEFNGPDIISENEHYQGAMHDNH